jgi:hypothetical protein
VTKLEVGSPECFYPLMHALSDEQQLERLESKVDDFIADTKDEFRSVRSEIGAMNRSLHAMWLTMIIGFAGIVIAMLAQV